MVFRGVGYPEEDNLKAELAPRMAEKKFSRFSQGLMRRGLANSPRQAQIVTFILFGLTAFASLYFYSTTLEKGKIEPRDPYVRPLPL